MDVEIWIHCENALVGVVLLVLTSLATFMAMASHYSRKCREPRGHLDGALRCFCRSLRT